MITISRYFIKTAFLLMIIGMMCGVWQYGHIAFNWFAPYTLPMAHAHIILIGGMMNMIIGIACWFFPRTKKGYRFYRPKIIWGSYWLLNFSTLGRFCIELVSGITSNNTLLKTGFWLSVIQIGTVGIIFAQLWERVISKGSFIRESMGEQF